MIQGLKKKKKTGEEGTTIMNQWWCKVKNNFQLVESNLRFPNILVLDNDHMVKVSRQRKAAVERLIWTWKETGQSHLKIEAAGLEAFR